MNKSDKLINDEVRPSSKQLDIKVLLNQLLEDGVTFDAEIFFNKWTRSIEINSPYLLNAFRILHHYERYWFSADYVKERFTKNNICVFDVGVGEGHSLHQFVERFSTNNVSIDCNGIEIDKNIIAITKKLYPDINIIDGNILIKEINNTYDVVFCFELIGNCSLNSDKLLLNKIKDICAHNGYIFLSIANFLGTEEGEDRAKDYSARLYNSQSFIKLIKGVFHRDKIEYFGQLYPLKRVIPSLNGIWPNPGLDKETDFLIAVIKKSCD